MQDAALKYGGEWMRCSREFVQGYESRWQLLQDLVEGYRKLSEWNTRLSAQPSDQTAAEQSSAVAGRWQAEMVLNPAYIQDAFADRAYNEIFGRSNYFTVTTKNIPSAGPVNVTDPVFSTARKLESHLHQKLTEAEFSIRTHEALRKCCLFGSVFGKVYWYYKEVPQQSWGIDPYSMQIKINRQMRRIADYPCLQIVPIASILPDWTATHYNIQQWSGIGHRTTIGYWDAVALYDAGILHLNRAEFDKAFKDGSGQMGEETSGLVTDPKAEGISSSEIPKVQLWEWHGQLPYQGKLIECCMVIATYPSEKSSPASGVLCRLTEGPVLWSGERPFVAAQFKPSSKPFGDSGIEPNLDLIYYTSEMIDQLINNARLTTNAIVKVKKGSPMALKLDKDRNLALFGPGKVWEYEDDPNEILVQEIKNEGGQVMQMLIQYLEGKLDERSNVTPGVQGDMPSRVTATGAYQAGMQADIPFSIRAKHFAQTFVEKAGKLCLSLMQQFELSDQDVRMPDASGMETSQTLSAQEIMTGEYDVHCSILAQDQTKEMRAQSMTQDLPALVQTMPILQQQGHTVNLVLFLKKLLQYRGFDNPDEVVVPLPPPPPMPQPGMLPPGPGMPPEGALPQGPGAPPPGPQGGPMGEIPSDPNAFMQFLQMNMNNVLGGGPNAQ